MSFTIFSPKTSIRAVQSAASIDLLLNSPCVGVIGLEEAVRSFVKATGSTDILYLIFRVVKMAYPGFPIFGIFRDTLG